MILKNTEHLIVFICQSTVIQRVVQPVNPNEFHEKQFRVFPIRTFAIHSTSYETGRHEASGTSGRCEPRMLDFRSKV